jgi:hypothetical protein
MGTGSPHSTRRHAQAKRGRACPRRDITRRASVNAVARFAQSCTPPATRLPPPDDPAARLGWADKRGADINESEGGAGGGGDGHMQRRRRTIRRPRLHPRPRRRQAQKHPPPPRLAHPRIRDPGL